MDKNEIVSQIEADVNRKNDDQMVNTGYDSKDQRMISKK